MKREVNEVKRRITLKYDQIKVNIKKVKLFFKKKFQKNKYARKNHMHFLIIRIFLSDNHYKYSNY